MYDIANIIATFCYLYFALFRLYPYDRDPFIRFYPYFLCSDYRIFYTRGQNMSISLFRMIIDNVFLYR